MKSWAGFSVLLAVALFQVGFPGRRAFVQPQTITSCGDMAIDAGPARAVDLPATDVSLFGHVVTNPGNDAYSVLWTQIGGSASTISANWSTRTTVTVTSPGTYIYQMAVSDATVTNCTALTTVTVNPETFPTRFYIDTDYTGGMNDGSAAHPWTSLVDGDGQRDANWTAIRTALSNGNVYVYFSARHCGGAGCAGGDTPEVLTGTLRILRMCRTRPTSPQLHLLYCTSVDTTVPHLLTLDGMSKYNAGTPAVPVWSPYVGTSRFKINCVTSTQCDSLSIGNDDSQFPLSRDYVRIRGFEATGINARIDWRGSFNDWEYLNLHDATGTGPGFIINDSITDFPDCTPIDAAQYIGLRHNTIARVMGEGYYIGGTYLDSLNSPGCPPVSGFNPPLSTDLLEENNHILASGQNSQAEEGNCMDMKAAWQHVTARFNDCDSQVSVQEGCFSWEGAFNDIPTDYIIENNHIHGNELQGYCINGLISNGVIIRNNLIEGNFGRVASTNNAFMIVLIKQPNFTTPSYNLPMHHIRVYNNTIVNTTATAPGIGVCIVIGGDGTLPIDDVQLRNNACVANGSTNQILNGSSPAPTNYSSDYNLFADATGMACGSGSDFAEGTHSICQTTTGGIFTSLASDWHLTSGSPAIVGGLSLNVFANMPIVSELFNVDFASALRQGASAWDIGAYKF